MQRIELTEGNVSEVAAKAAEMLRVGGVVMYPTDTLYGLGADALSDTAVEKIYDIKGRDEQKPIHAILSDVQVADGYVQMSETARELARKFGGAVTLVMKKKQGLDSGIARGLDTFGFRIPSNAFCISFAQNFGGPITATSANKSGMISARRVEDILTQLGASAEKIDLVVDAGELPQRRPSTVVDLSVLPPKIIREGLISGPEIASILGAY